MTITASTESLRTCYQRLEADRRPFLDRARDCAKLTIPSMMVPLGHTATSTLETPFQAFGARAVNNLASKLLLTLLPPSGSFFRLRIDDFAAEVLSGSKEAKAEIEAALAKVESAVMTEVETTAIRINAFEALKHLLVCGNALCFMPDAGGLQIYRLDQYVLERDCEGNILRFITVERLGRELLEPDVLKQLPRQDSSPDAAHRTKEKVEIYTGVVRRGKRWDTWQEIEGVEIEGSRGRFTERTLPYIALRMSAISNESYGRGLVEEYFGDIVSLEGLSQAIVEAAAAMARILFLVNPNGLTNKVDVAEAPNGAVRDGIATDVTVLQAEKFADLRVASDTRQKILEELARAFLLNSSVQRQAERVTAEEVRYMAQELEDALGGVYSVLSQEFQLPLVKLLLSRMEKSNRIPKLPSGVKPSIVTGLEALGRGHDLQRLDLFVEGALKAFGPELVGQYIDLRDYFLRRANALALNVEGLVKSEERIAQEQQQAQASAMAEKLGPPAIQAASRMASASAPETQPQ